MNPDPLELPRIGSRRWIAWKLVQLAHRIFDAEYYETITVTDSNGEEVVEFLIVSDLWGNGVSMQTGSTTFGGYNVSWGTDVHPAWLEEGA